MSQPEDLRKWRLPRGRHGLPRELVTRSQRERLLAAVVRVTAAKGYEATTVADILEEAGVGRESFYELFRDKRDCMLAAHTILIDDLEAKVRTAYCGGSGPWQERVTEALAAALDWFAADPVAARFTVVELAAIGPVSRVRFQKIFSSFVALLEEGMEDVDRTELEQASNLAIGAGLVRIYEEVVLGRADELPSLLPELTYEILVPFLGEAAAGEQRSRAAAIDR
jgi:AcrR family transcriptional regulator